MANLGTNYMVITGSIEKIGTVVQKLKKVEIEKGTNKRKFLFETLIDKEKLLDVESNDIDFGFEITDANKLIIVGDSKWSPPIEGTLLLSQLYDLHITHEFSEPGCNSASVYECKNGECIRDEEYENGYYDIQNALMSDDDYIIIADTSIEESLGGPIEKSIEVAFHTYDNDCDDAIVYNQGFKKLIKQLLKPGVVVSESELSEEIKQDSLYFDFVTLLHDEYGIDFIK